jgi:hypothetical protein
VFINPQGASGGQGTGSQPQMNMPNLNNLFQDISHMMSSMNMQLPQNIQMNFLNNTFATQSNGTTTYT